jgi:hypothetical protein
VAGRPLGAGRECLIGHVIVDFRHTGKSPSCGTFIGPPWSCEPPRRRGFLLEFRHLLQFGK